VSADDLDLLRQARSDPEALGELYRRHAPTVYSWLLRRTRESIAAELTAETFAQAALSLHRFQDQGHGTVQPWLLGIARNLWRRFVEREIIESRARQRLGMSVQSLDTDFDAITDRLSREHLKDRVRDALASLPESQREAVRLRVVEEKSYEEVAEALGCSVVAARLRVMRGLAQMARCLGESSTA
jgi:RNA polymerase sigma factor (sigma-70 family)